MATLSQLCHHDENLLRNRLVKDYWLTDGLSTGTELIFLRDEFAI
ncbi:hypothetical protein LRHK_2171 [Lacticaseibacillus rhamnosus ATCC 8530]|nr:hypothetical protein LRHK_2171 [Lacticaseibacillus rhamnosus ATCC 8530]